MHAWTLTRSAPDNPTRSLLRVTRLGAHLKPSVEALLVPDHPPPQGEPSGKALPCRYFRGAASNQRRGTYSEMPRFNPGPAPGEMWVY